MAKYVLVDQITNIVNNIVEWDGQSLYIPPDNCILIQTDVASVGDIYNTETQEFIRPISVRDEPTAEQKLANAGLTVEELKTLLGL